MRGNTKMETLKIVTNAITLAGSILILFSLSVDIIYTKSYRLTEGMLDMQLIICLIFIVDFFLMMFTSDNKWDFFWTHIIILLVSIPYLSIMQWNGLEAGKSMYITLKCLPLIRGLYGIFLAINTIVSSNIKALTVSYLFSVLALTYLSALLFFAFEESVNPGAAKFGNCLWWSGMSVTTVGAELFAVTAIGKILSVFLPGLGMLMFPLFTVYVTELFQKIRSNKKTIE